MSNSIDVFTGISIIIIIICTILSAVYINYCKRKSKLLSKHRWIDQLPSLISTLGVLGTFAGITKGLMNFNPEDLDKSIPVLLDGLKTAFFTSLAGMIGSLFLSRQVSASFDKEDNGVSDINIAANKIVDAVKNLSDNNKTTLQELQRQAERQANDQIAFYKIVSENLQTLQESATNSSSNTTSLVLQAQAQSTSLEELTKEIKNLGTILHNEVLDIERKMTETNVLLTQKFDGFTELLKKSNTEALVEVMKAVTEEFQKQMNTLISKLIQENFEQLNQSVEHLNTWQQENKEMISSLTVQYREMTNNFEKTSATLTKVVQDTRILVGDGGKLTQLIEALNKVIIEDKHFVEITTNLTEVVTCTKDNMEKFDESTKALNEWVRKQRNFVDGVSLLIEKLNDLNKIRDYNEQFWQETKRSLEEGVGYLTQGAKSLDEQLTNLDKQFYTRLSATLAELDSCIQAMINKQ